VPTLNSRDAAAECTATLTGPDHLADCGVAPLAASLLGQPLRVQFGCEGVTISGLELEVQPEPQPEPQPQPVSLALTPTPTRKPSPHSYPYPKLNNPPP
jgi:hypothetical protein